MTSLTQGGEPIPSEEEARHWWKVWFDAHPGRPPATDEMPWPIQRYEALKELKVAQWETIKTAWHTMREMGRRPETSHWIEQQKTEEALKVAWTGWRAGVIQHYRLDPVNSKAL